MDRFLSVPRKAQGSTNDLHSKGSLASRDNNQLSRRENDDFVNIYVEISAPPPENILEETTFSGTT
jgi:hypothetical protein